MANHYQITRGNDELLNIASHHKNDIILIDFYADWCGPCKAIAPLLNKLVKAYQNKAGCKRLVLCKVNVDDDNNADACDNYKVQAMPTFVWIENMKLAATTTGANAEQVSAITEQLCIPK